MVAAEIHPADAGDTTTVKGTLEAAAEGLEAAGAAPDAETPADLVADKGYHSRAVLKDLDGGPWRSRIAEPKPKDVLRWHGDREAQRAVYGNRARLRSGVAKEALKLRAQRVERSFEHTLDRGGLRRTHLRGRANVQKRYLIHVAGFNLGLVMRLVLGAGTPRELAARGGFVLWLIDPPGGLVVIFILPPQAPPDPPSDASRPALQGPRSRNVGRRPPIPRLRQRAALMFAVKPLGKQDGSPAGAEVDGRMAKRLVGGGCRDGG